MDLINLINIITNAKVHNGARNIMLFYIDKKYCGLSKTSIVEYLF